MAVFRFLINVDKCLDMSHYQCFFYKLKSRGVNGQSLFHLSEAQLLEADPFSLRNAVSDVRMYLDKYPYHVGDCQIIVDRGEAIYEAIKQADENTVVLITGKGRETRQKRGTQYIDTPSDVEYVEKFLANR